MELDIWLERAGDSYVFSEDYILSSIFLFEVVLLLFMDIWIISSWIYQQNALSVYWIMDEVA